MCVCAHVCVHMRVYMCVHVCVHVCVCVSCVCTCVPTKNNIHPETASRSGPVLTALQGPLGDRGAIVLAADTGLNFLNITGAAHGLREATPSGVLS